MLIAIQDAGWARAQRENQAPFVGCVYCHSSSCQNDPLAMIDLMNIASGLLVPTLITGNFDAPAAMFLTCYSRYG